MDISRNQVRPAAAFCALAWLALGPLGCVTPQSPGKVQVTKGSPAEARAAQQAEAQPAPTGPERNFYKRTVAIGRFSNETLYGRGIFVNASLDPLGQQAADILATELIRSDRFIVFERPDVEKVESEQGRHGKGTLVGVNTLILGSITEFGRSTDGQQGFLSSTKSQEARAKVNVRLVDVDTGRAFFTADGSGVAKKESGETAGFGSFSGYDRTLNDRAIAAAIVDLVDEIINELEARPWRTFLIAAEGPNLFLAGGKSQGIAPGDELLVMQRGKTLTSPQTGLPIELPGTEVARIRIASTFGDSEVDEGSVAQVLSGGVSGVALGDLFVIEAPREDGQ